MTKDQEMPLGEHLEELRIRLIYCIFVLFGCIVICLLDQNFYMALVLLPHNQAMQALNLPVTIQVLRYEESFFCHLKVAVIVALILTMPFILKQIWLFVTVGLLEHERKYVRSFFPFMLFFFGFGVIFGYSILIPLGLRFLAGYGSTGMIQVGFTLSSYISLFFILTFVSGVMFELPLFMLFAVKIGFIKTQFYLENWRHAFLAAFIIAAVLTPPDVVTQLLMAIPMIFLYLLGILMCRFSERLADIRKYVSSPE